jgi:hypothetical protein
MTGADWYYSIDDERHGPVSFRDLQDQAALGQLSSDDLIWKEGWTDWTPVSHVKGLKHRLEADHELGASDDPTPMNDPYSHELPVHFLDHLLDAVRTLFPHPDIGDIGRVMVEFGRYSLYAAMLIGLVFSTFWAIRIDSLSVIFFGAGGVLTALALQYCAMRLCRAIPGLIQSTPTRMSSTAFLDSFAVIMLIGGVLGFGACTWAAIRYESLNLFFLGLAIFLSFEQLGFLSLNPEALNIRISKDASSGEEAVGIISFFTMLPLRFVPGVFGIGTTVGSVGLLVCCLGYLKGGENVETAMTYTPVALGLIFGCAAFPLLMYVYFVSAYLYLDVIRSLLIIPSKLDRLSDQKQGSQSN